MTKEERKIMIDEIIEMAKQLDAIRREKQKKSAPSLAINSENCFHATAKT